jgi:predicted small lipoprotein YifL
MKTICLAVLILLTSLAACEREGPAEKAGEAVDRAGRDIRDAVKGDK